MERRFGAMQRVDHSAVDMNGEGVGLDPHMLEGLKVRSQWHGPTPAPDSGLCSESADLTWPRPFFV